MYNKLSSKYSIIFSISIYVFLLFFFPNKLYWVDDWIILDELVLAENNSNIVEIFRPFNSQLIVLTKILFLIDFSFFKLNPRIYEIFNVILLFFSSIILLNHYKKKKLNNLSLFVISLIIVNLTLFPIISQPINITWIFSMFFIIIFLTKYSSTNTKPSIMVILSIVLGAITFSLSLIISIYLIFLLSVKFYSKKLNKIDYLYLSISLISLLFALSISTFYNESENLLTHMNINESVNFNYLYLSLLNYFVVIGSLYIPWIESLFFIAAMVGIIQTIIILYILLHTLKKKTFYEFLLRNNILIIGVIFGILAALFRNEIAQSISPRYVVGVIFFQIGFWLLVINYLDQKLIKKRYFLILIFPLLAYLNGALSPYFGIHWQVQRSLNSYKILDCFYKNKNNIEPCYLFAYEKIFFGSKNFEYNKFKELFYLSILK